ncbi:MAG: PorV/PorQ family protein [Candidatus Marinimicrobia bacterium]|nr:PorV/PorQ family protein [Candidatus Neomarinimicrobiota bacterium]
MKLTALLLLTLISATTAQINTKTGTSTAQFLKIGVHARSLGMGDASAGSVSDIASIYSNPAGLSRYGVQEVVFSQMDWFAGIKLLHFAGGINLQNAGVVAVQITTLDYGEEAVRTIDKQEGTGEFYSAMDLSIGLAYARNLTNSFSFGAQFKYLNSRIWHMSANAVAVDVGALFFTPFKGVRLGMAITNFGTKMKLEGRNIRFLTDPDETMAGNNSQIPAVYELSRWPLPLTFRVGLSGEAIQTDRIRLSWSVDALHPSDNSEYIDIGTELALGNRLFLRGGLHNLFMVDEKQGRIALGAGLYHAFSPSLRVKVDYAWVDYALLLPVSMLSFTVEY